MLLGDQAQRVQTLAPSSFVSFCITIFPLKKKKKKTHGAAVYTIQAVVEDSRLPAGGGIINGLNSQAIKICKGSYFNH